MNAQEKTMLSLFPEITSNKAFMDFLTKEAIEQTAKDISEDSGTKITPEQVEALIPENKKVSDRVTEYKSVGIITALQIKYRKK